MKHVRVIEQRRIEDSADGKAMFELLLSCHHVVKRRAQVGSPKKRAICGFCD
jgi:cytochrome c2